MRIFLNLCCLYISRGRSIKYTVTEAARAFRSWVR